MRPVERLLYRVSGVRAEEEMDWKVYAVSMLLFNGLGLLAVYALQRLQGALPLNPQGLGAVTPDSDPGAFVGESVTPPPPGRLV